MTPTKTKTRKPVATLGRPRSEILVAIAVAAGIVLATVLIVWLIRPGKPGTVGTGGLLSRQPRVTMWVVLTAAALALAIWWVLRGAHRPRRVSSRVAVIVAIVVVLVVAVAAAIFWPDGLVRHYPSKPKTDTSTPDTSPSISAPVKTTPPTTKSSATTTPTTKGP
jgi:amino acid transporter